MKCENCNSYVDEELMMCVDCGTSYLKTEAKLKTHATIPKPKLEGLTSVNITIVLGFIIGIIVMGLGHVYTKQIRKGLTIWIGSMVLYSIVIVTRLSDASVLIGSFNLTNLYYIFVIGLVCLYVWQGYDAYSTAVKENRAISNTTRQQSESY